MAWKITMLALLLAPGSLPAQPPELRIPEAEAKKAAIERPAPAYPIVARQFKLKGSVAIEAIVGEDGRVEEAKALSGNAILTKPSVEAVKKWKFTPFLAHGKPARAIVSLTFEFDNR